MQSLIKLSCILLIKKVVPLRLNQDLNKINLILEVFTFALLHLTFAIFPNIRFSPGSIYF